MVNFLSGAIFALSLVAALYFFRFWRQTADRLFAIFSLAFTCFAASRLVLSVLEEGDEARTWVYLLRLVAFLLIVVAVVDKNRAHTRA
jgi:hypothetical protein